MQFRIFYGRPEFAEFMKEQTALYASGELTGRPRAIFKKLVRTLDTLAEHGPGHAGLHTHEIDDLTEKYGIKIFQSYIENNTPTAYRLFWFYAPNNRGQIVVGGLEPHPNKGQYKKIN